MMHKGYTGHVEYDHEAGILHGQVLGLRDVITFEGRTTEEVSQAFKDSVDDYLEFCKELGQEPEKPYSGRILLRISPALHRALAQAAARRRVSLNQFMEQVLSASMSGLEGPANTQEARAAE